MKMVFWFILILGMCVCPLSDAHANHSDDDIKTLEGIEKQFNEMVNEDDSLNCESVKKYVHYDARCETGWAMRIAALGGSICLTGDEVVDIFKECPPAFER